MTNKNSESEFEECNHTDIVPIVNENNNGSNRVFCILCNKVWGEQKTIDEQAERIKTLEAENALLKESNERLENSLREFKVFGTDECTECVNEKGRAQIGESYNRITLFYKPKEHSIHKQN